MKRFLTAWLVAALCASAVGCAASALAEEQEDLSLEFELEEPMLSEASLPEVDELALDLDDAPLELAEPEPLDVPDLLEDNAAGAGGDVSNRIVLHKYIRYEITDGVATVVSADKAVTEAYIPETIKGYPVQHIAAGAFADHTKLWDVKVPDSVLDIGERAFEGCTALVNVALPQRDIPIGAYAFKGCTMISHFDLPEGFTEITEGMFENCAIMWRITIPSTVTRIGEGAFRGCLMLKQFTLPDGLTEIGQGTFEQCEAMKSLVIPDSVATIGQNAFRGCTSLGKMTLGRGLVSIEANAFRGCTDLHSVNLPAGVKTIGEYAFAYCEDLEKQLIPGNVTSVGNGAFFHCGDLEQLCVEAGVTSLGDYCFAQCKKLTGAQIDESVTSIGVDAFSVGDSAGIDDWGSVQLGAPVGNPKNLKFYGRENCAAYDYAKAHGIPYVVQKILATSVSIAEGKTVTLYVGQTLQLTAKQAPANAETAMKWTSSSSSVRVSKNGLLTPKHSGKATITVKTDNGKKATIAVKVVDAKSVSIDQGKTITMKVGETLQLSATVLPEQVTSELSWSSSKKRIATVSKTGLVKAKRKGKVTITVRTENGKKAKLKLKVID